ncbi:MAG: hypothetical protein SO053_01125 [Bifidobacterium animalis]|nr:hypothetical protein [Bifidobacterium animalis]MDY5039746.1 hypothetical protein [Bifidobacterium animalis]
MNLSIADLLSALAGLATGFGASGVVLWLLNRYDKRHPITVRDERVDEIQEENRKLRETQKALKSAVIELAYLRISDKYDRFVHRGFAHSNEKRIVQRIYDAYHLLGGNGTGSQMIEEILKLPSFPPDGADTDDE